MRGGSGLRGAVSCAREGHSPEWRHAPRQSGDWRSRITEFVRRLSWRPEPGSTLAANFDLATPFAFLAMTAAPAGITRGLTAVAARCGGEAFSCGPAAAVTRGTISVAGRITINADMAWHGAPPSNFGDSARVSHLCQI